MRNILLKSAVALALGIPLVAGAESNFTTAAAGTVAATARVDFSIIIPKFVSLRVGTTGAGNFDLITFSPTAGQVDAGTTPISGTGGDATGGAVNASVRGNNGQIALSATSSAGGLASGTDVIPFSQISTTSTGGTGLQAPILTNGASAAAVSPTLTGTKITNQSATWTYRYLNSAVVAAGTYAGTVTYTATMP